MRINGKVAIVFGAARTGIGRSYAEALLDKGAKVYQSDSINP